MCAGARFRFALLFVVCMFTFGSYFAFDLPSAIMDELMAHLGVGKAQYQAFYTAYTAANFASVVFGGYLLDRAGARVGAAVFTAAICAGQLLWAAGVQARAYGAAAAAASACARTRW